MKKLQTVIHNYSQLAPDFIFDENILLPLTILKSKNFPFPCLSSLHLNVALSVIRCRSVILSPHNDQYCDDIITLLSLLSSTSEMKFQDHCVANTLPPTLSISLCIFPFWKHGRNVFCGLFLKFLFGFADGEPDSVSADLGKSVPYLKTTLVHIPLRIDHLKTVCLSLLSFSEVKRPLLMSLHESCLEGNFKL